MLIGASRIDIIIPVLRELCWFPLPAHAQFKELVMTYKALSGLGAVESMHSHQDNLETEDLRWVPSPADARLGATMEKAFSVVAPWLRNLLPRKSCLAPGA